LKKIAKYLLLGYVLILFGCAAREYPIDLDGDIVPINTDNRYKIIIEQHNGKTNSTAKTNDKTEK
jgi:hypothetical protein